MSKKVWEQPKLEVLDVSMTMHGKGRKYVDFVSPSDLDITDDKPETPIPWEPSRS
ncbi:paeninodin family lasso peptide [Paenibacillus pinihumi]|uniref:paeninodin family lasso peptide n=1 Tax=Paenibacillus pinihumi TaxID=669462 RepID=UPI0003FA0D20|nr:paeninodin family lasso peptide [Paenibacillus pinihumi]